MKTDLTGDLGARAAMHAALADPARLEIVDTLSYGDASPSELAALLGMASNLLAHHLHTLEGVGLVTRRRSDADRRRSYLRLVPDSLELVTATPLRGARRVVFVCTANSARSHLAAALWRRTSPVPAASAGTHPAARIELGAIEAAKRHHLPLQRLRPRQLNEVRHDGDVIVTVCDLAHEELGVSDIHWSVPDPVPIGGHAAYDRAYAELDRRVGDLAVRVTVA